MAFYAVNSKDSTYAADVYLQNSDGQKMGNTYTMRRHSDEFSIGPAGHGVGYIEARFTNNRNILITNSSAAGEQEFNGPGSVLKVEAREMGDTSLNIAAYRQKGDTEPVFQTTVNITVAFSVNEYLNDNAKNASIKKIFIEDERSALILDYGAELPFGKNASDPGELKYLNLMFGNASQDITNTTSSAIQADWLSNNEDIIEIDKTMKGDDNVVRGGIRATGAGRTTLSVSWRDDTTTRQDTIVVYVRPRITNQSNENIGTNSSGIDDGTGGGTPDSVYQVENGAIINVSVKFENNQLDAISDKLAWVIAKKKDDKDISCKGFPWKCYG